MKRLYRLSFQRLAQMGVTYNSLFKPIASLLAKNLYSYSSQTGKTVFPDLETSPFKPIVQKLRVVISRLHWIEQSPLRRNVLK